MPANEPYGDRVTPPTQSAGEIVLRLNPGDARALWHAAGTAVSLMDQVGTVPPHAPLYGQRDRLVSVAQRLDHEINHAGGFNPLGGASRGIERYQAREMTASTGIVDTEPGTPTIIAHVGLRSDAEKIVRALNNSEGAVDDG